MCRIGNINTKPKLIKMEVSYLVDLYFSKSKTMKQRTIIILIVLVIFSLGLVTSSRSNSTNLRGTRAAQTTCEDYQVSFCVDDDSTSQQQCGECIPGSSGIDTKEFCQIDEYCTDEGKCESITKQPLFMTTCPRELGKTLTKDGFCGPGLRCIQHKCIQCVTGMMDYADGKICIDSVWTFNNLKIGFYHPTVIFLTSFVVLVGFNMSIDCCFDIVYSIRKKKRKQIEERYRIFYQYIRTRSNKL